MDTTNSILVRPAMPEDAEGIVNILNPLIREGKQTVLSKEYSVAEEAEFIRNFPARGLFIVAEQKNRILGFQTIEPFAPYSKAFDHVGIVGTYVCAIHRNKGIGRRLFEYLEAKAPELGFKKIFTYIIADNHQSINYYQKIGFKVVGTAKKQAKLPSGYKDEIIVEYFFSKTG